MASLRCKITESKLFMLPTSQRKLLCNLFQFFGTGDDNDDNDVEDDDEDDDGGGEGGNVAKTPCQSLNF